MLDLDPSTLVIIGLGLVIAFMAVWIAYLELRLKKFTGGRSGKNLEEIIVQLHHRVARTDDVNEEIKKHLINMEGRLRRSIQHVKTVRFNPFRDQGQGSNQSFATAFLNEEGCGAVITSLYTRDRVSVYAKPINNRASEYELTEEERAAITQ